MKTSCTVLLFFLFVVSVKAQAPLSPQQFSQLAGLEMKARTGNPERLPQNIIDNYDISYHRCVWQVDPAVQYIAGNITTYFKPLTSGFDTILFNCSNLLTVDSVLYQGNAIPFTHSSDLIRAAFPSPLAVNVSDSVTVFYQGAPTTSGFGSFMTGVHNSVPVLATLSEPYGSSDWWPCKNGLTDKADSLDVLITTPAAYRAASNGLLVNETTNGNLKTYHWKHRYPIVPYLVCMAATNYVQYTHNVPFGNTNTTILNYVYPEDSASAEWQTAFMVPVMQFYDSLFGLYPFADEKYGHCQFNVGGGMEHQTFTFVGGFHYELLCHELAHHWFGDKVTCGSWEDIWLNEGFATYLSGLCYEFLQPAWWMPFKQGRISYITSQPDGSVWCDDTTTHTRIFDDRLSYAKGGMFLNQLRWVIGDSAFFNGIRNYLNDPAHAYGFARTANLKAHWEAEYGQSLTWYFNDWFTGEGFPSYLISWDQQGSQVTFTVNQVQSHPSVSFFELPLPIKFKNATQDTTIRINHTFSGETFTATIPFAADSLIFDPELWIISANNTVTSIAPLTLDPYIIMLPNPIHDELRVLFYKNHDRVVYEIHDINGKQITKGEARQPRILEVDMSRCAVGTYLVSFEADGMRCVKKVVKE